MKTHGTKSLFIISEFNDEGNRYYLLWFLTYHVVSYLIVHVLVLSRSSYTVSME